MERGALRFWRWGAVALFALGLLIPFPSAAADLSKEEAVKKVIEKVVLPSSNRETLRAHFWPHPLRPGDVITVFRPDGERWPIIEPTWFFWIDDQPEALFGHPTRFVFVEIHYPINDFWGSRIFRNMKACYNAGYVTIKFSLFPSNQRFWILYYIHITFLLKLIGILFYLVYQKLRRVVLILNSVISLTIYYYNLITDFLICNNSII